MSVHATERECPLYEVLPIPRLVIAAPSATRKPELEVQPKERLHLAHIKLALEARHTRCRLARGCGATHPWSIQRRKHAIRRPALVPLLLAAQVAKSEGALVLTREPRSAILLQLTKVLVLAHIHVFLISTSSTHFKTNEAHGASLPHFFSIHSHLPDWRTTRACAKSEGRLCILPATNKKMVVAIDTPKNESSESESARRARGAVRRE